MHDWAYRGPGTLGTVAAPSHNAVVLRLVAFLMLAALTGCTAKEEAARQVADKLAQEGRELVKRGDEEEGAAKIQKALELRPGEPSFQLDLCRAWVSAERWPDALSACRDAVNLGPSDADAHYQLGRVALHLEHRDEALASLRESTRIDPKNAAAHHELATTLGTGDPSDEERQAAVVAARRAVEHAPDRVEHQVGLCKALMHAKECEESGQIIDGLDDEVEVGKLRALHYEACAK